MSWRLIMAIGSGGVVGALTRTLVVEMADEWRSLALLVVNVIGSFLLGVVVVRLVDVPTLRAGLGTGFCGAFTSMSTFAVDVAAHLDSGESVTGGLLAVGTIVLAATGAIVGLRIAGPE
ncbi:MAG: CrcB family protein [Acidimicrobiia bacterium]|nr:CrcB family protein [Acidimicrobiia bacterium]